MTDHLAAGADLDLTLESNHTVAGRLFVPGVNDDASDLEADMAGTWTLNGRVVDLDQQVETFVHDMNFELVENTLVGDEAIAGVRVRVTLTKQ